MFDRIVESGVTIALAITGIAVLAVLVSRRSQTPAVIGSLGGAFTESLAAAEAPVLSSSEVPGFSAYY
jgi:hypothetical protein